MHWSHAVVTCTGCAHIQLYENLGVLLPTPDIIMLPFYDLSDYSSFDCDSFDYESFDCDSFDYESADCSC